MSRQQILQSIRRYEKFLQLSDTGEISPTLDIDIVWHSHMQMHSEYSRFFTDTGRAFLDHVFCEKESVSMEIDNNLNARTITKWRERYGENYESNDDPWACFLDPDTVEDTQYSASNKIDRDFTRIAREKICSILRSDSVPLAEIESKDLPIFIEKLRNQYMGKLMDQCDEPVGEKLGTLPVAALNYLFQDAYFVFSKKIPSTIVAIDFNPNHAATYIDEMGVLRLSKKPR